MPAPDALEKLLIEKYGIAPDDAAAYAAQIISGTPDTHDAALKGEALGNVAMQQLDTMRGLGQFPAAYGAMSGGPINGVSGADMDAAVRLLDQSKSNTQQRAKNATAVVNATVENEGQRLRDMAAFVSDNPPEPTAAQQYTSRVQEQADQNYATDPRTGMRIPRPTHWVTNEDGIPSPVTIINVKPKSQNPYDVKLQRAMAMRKASLGF